jgi:lipopolysaccharide/colanic/teichoic acid biosynthesis glycosyltransferase
MTALSRGCKDALDRALAAVLLIALAPVLVAIALAVRASSPGPVLHRRRVLGLDGTPFDALKFRTMVAEADAILEGHPDLRQAFQENMKLPDDPRTTVLGRWLRRTSLDELPQLYNVLRGEMSLVGPRMIAPNERSLYGDAIGKRLSVKPGITGLWQVSGRQELSYSERVRLDLEYVERWSLWLDVVIIARTIPAVLSMRGAH